MSSIPFSISSVRDAANSPVSVAASQSGSGSARRTRSAACGRWPRQHSLARIVREHQPLALTRERDARDSAVASALDGARERHPHVARVQLAAVRRCIAWREDAPRLPRDARRIAVRRHAHRPQRARPRVDD
jgi:hypothetical protein